MIEAHEIDLNTSSFNQFEQSSYIIIEDQNNYIKVNDYILFRQIETVESETQYTGLHRLVQVKDIVKNQGLKEGYVLLLVNKF